MQVNEVMTKDIVTINSDDTILEACKRYNRYKIGCLLVLREGNMAGIVTERDIIKRSIIMPKDPFEAKVEEIMSKDIITISPTADVKEAAIKMGTNNIKKLPVVLDDGKPVGIITITDIVNLVPNMLKTIAEGGEIQNNQNESKTMSQTPI